MRGVHGSSRVLLSTTTQPVAILFNMQNQSTETYAQPSVHQRWAIKFDNPLYSANLIISAEPPSTTHLPFDTPLQFDGPNLTFVGVVIDVVQVQQSQAIVEIVMTDYDATLVMTVPRSQIPLYVIMDDHPLYELWYIIPPMADSLTSVYFRGE